MPILYEIKDPGNQIIGYLLGSCHGVHLSELPWLQTWLSHNSHIFKKVLVEAIRQENRAYWESRLIPWLEANDYFTKTDHRNPRPAWRTFCDPSASKHIEDEAREELIQKIEKVLHEYIQRYNLHNDLIDRFSTLGVCKLLQRHFMSGMDLEIQEIFKDIIIALEDDIRVTDRDEQEGERKVSINHRFFYQTAFGLLDQEQFLSKTIAIYIKTGTIHSVRIGVDEEADLENAAQNGLTPFDADSIRVEAIRTKDFYDKIISQLSSTKPGLVVVGHAHLYGTEEHIFPGIITYLEQARCKVIPIDEIVKASIAVDCTPKLKLCS